MFSREKAGEPADSHGQSLSPVALRPTGQPPGHEEAQSGQAPSACQVCVSGWGGGSAGCIGILGL